MIPTYIEGYNVRLHTNDWDAIALILRNALAPYIWDEIAGYDGQHTIYGLTEDEIQSIAEAIGALQIRLLKAVHEACQGCPKGTCEVLDAAD